jgi:hypothetical protein
MTKRLFIPLLLLLFLLLAAALIFLDFRALRGQTVVASQVNTYSFKAEEGRSASPNQQLIVYVDAREEVRQALQPALREALAHSGAFGNVTTGSMPAAPSEGNVLVVTVDPDRLLWTPFFSSANLKVSLAYASDGEVAWIDDTVVDLTAEEGSPPVTRIRGDLQVTNSAYGFMSGPGYMHYLDQEIALQIGDVLQTQLAATTPI